MTPHGIGTKTLNRSLAMCNFYRANDDGNNKFRWRKFGGVDQNTHQISGERIEAKTKANIPTNKSVTVAILYEKNASVLTSPPPPLYVRVT